jgi:hypothetical protein
MAVFWVERPAPQLTGLCLQTGSSDLGVIDIAVVSILLKGAKLLFMTTTRTS